MEKTTDRQVWLAANRDFHRGLYTATGLELTISLLEQLTGQVERYLHKRGDGVFRGPTATEEHHAIIAACRARDTTRAQLLIREHIDHTRMRVIEAIDEKKRGIPSIDM